MARISEWRRDDGRSWLDDPTIADEEILLRRVPSRQLHWDPERGRYRPSSAAFDDDNEGDPMSVYLNSTMQALGLEAERTLDDQEPGFGVAGVFARVVRDEEQVVCRDPDPGPPFHICDPAHGLVAGAKSTKRRSRVGRQFFWVVEPPNVDVPPPERQPNR
jgi:hypothetical protein